MSQTEKYRFGKHTDKRPGIQKSTESQRPFGRRNFIYMAASLLLIIIGFILMSGPGSSIEGGFNPDIFSTRRIVIGPTLAFLGFLSMAFAIVCSPDRIKRKAGGNVENHTTGQTADNLDS